MNYKQLILDRLLDKYEKSKSFTEESSKRRIVLKMGKDDFKEYDIEKPIIRETINTIVEELSVKGLVGFEWLKHEKGNIIEKVWLNVSCVKDCYTEINRRPKRYVLESLACRIADLKSKPVYDWMLRFLTDVEKAIHEKASTAGLLPANEEQSRAILDALDLMMKLNGSQCMERVFSLRCYNDSKYFEKKVRSRLIGIMKRYCADQEMIEEMPDDEVLIQAGILQTPEQIDFKGAITGTINGIRIDFSAFIFGASINMDTIKEMNIDGIGCIRKILFIENKANYVQFLAENKDNTLMIVFHGGFYSPARGIFYKKLYEAAFPYGIEFYHWGDIDLGGFLIFSRLKTNIIPSLKPYMMDRKSFESRTKYWVEFDSKYALKLKRLLKDDWFIEFEEIIKLMLEKGMKLEQEAFLCL